MDSPSATIIDPLLRYNFRSKLMKNFKQFLYTIWTCVSIQLLFFRRLSFWLCPFTPPLTTPFTGLLNSSLETLGVEDRDYWHLYIALLLLEIHVSIQQSPSFFLLRTNFTNFASYLLASVNFLYDSLGLRYLRPMNNTSFPLIVRRAKTLRVRKGRTGVHETQTHKCHLSIYLLS